MFSLNYIEVLNSLKTFDSLSYDSKKLESPKFSFSKRNASLVGYTTKDFTNGYFEFSDISLYGEPKKLIF